MPGKRNHTGQAVNPSRAGPATIEKPPAEVIRGPGKVPVRLQVNDEIYNIEVEPRRSLLDVLRDDLHLTGTKKVCNMGEWI
jgi:xanthine dehydrogenase YagT iron-sulfur-binding subunit